ncbi:fungal specific transcription factor domain-containing protein [Sarocladium implicatum]|nr:fungal specific transcription factor domain-containing protein [Sarocladium implicatum]
MSEVGRMLQDGAGVRFVDSYTLAAILENLSELRAIIETESLNENGMTPLKEATPESDLEPLQNSVKVSSNHVHELQPEPGLAIRLWHLYLERVNPLLKITHIPTLQPAVMKAAGSLQNTPLEYQALLFAIYIIGAISISHDEAHHMIGMPRDDAIERFTKGLKIVLVQLDFVKNYNMVVLQALVLYATALQGRYDRHAAWVLNGTVLRIAQKMGYHRDGEALNLPPFETEMRRRIWWQIISNDVKYALFSGLNRSLFPVHWDTKRPSNLNDADMYPGLTAPAKDRNGPTEMAYVLITTEITKSLGRIAKNPGFDAAILGRSRDYARGNETLEAANMEEYQAIVRDLDVNVQEIERRFVDRSAGKVHEAALIIRQLIISKALEMLGAGDHAVHTPQDRLMRILVNNLEDACAWQTSMAKYGFRWAPQMHFNAEVLTLLTILLAETPDAPIAHRAWDAIEACYREQLGLHNTAHKVYHEQAILTLRAWQTRKSIEPSGASRTLVQEPGFISNLKATVQTYDSKSCSSFSSPDYAPNVINPLSQATELDALLGGYFDLSLFQQRDACHTEPPIRTRIT